MKIHLQHTGKNKFVKLYCDSKTLFVEKGNINEKGDTKSTDLPSEADCEASFAAKIRLYEKLGYQEVIAKPKNYILIQGEYFKVEFKIFDAIIVRNRLSLKTNEITDTKEKEIENKEDLLNYLSFEKFYWERDRYEIIETDFDLDTIPTLSLFEAESQYLENAVVIDGDLIEKVYKAKEFIVVNGNTSIENYFLLDDDTLKSKANYGILYFKGNVKAKHFLINHSTWFQVFVDGDFEAENVLLSSHHALVVKGKTTIQNLIQFKENLDNIPKEGIQNYYGIKDKSDDEIFFKEKYRDMFGVNFKKVTQGIIQGQNVFVPKVYTRLSDLANLFATEFFNNQFNQPFSYLSYAGFEFINPNSKQIRSIINRYGFGIDNTIIESHTYLDKRTKLGCVLLHKKFIPFLEGKDNSTIDIGNRFKWLLRINPKKSDDENFQYWDDRGMGLNQTYQNELPSFKNDPYLALSWFIIFSYFNDDRKNDLLPFLKAYKFNGKKMFDIGSRVEAARDFFEQIGVDGNIEMKGKDLYFFRDIRANAIRAYKKYINK